MHDARIDSAASGVRLDQPAPASAIAMLHPQLGTRFIVVVDTEEEFDWAAPPARAQRSTSAIRALPEAQAFFRGHGVAPIYAIDHPVAATPESAAILRGFAEAKEATIGAHLHPWVNPPHLEAVTGPNSFAGNLPPALEAAKLDALTQEITAAIGARPTVFRAGRYGVGRETARLLVEAGYTLDLSVRARFDYSGEQGPDFTHAGLAPFRAGPGGALLSVPLSTAYTGVLRTLGGRLYPAIATFGTARGALARLGLLARVPLTPEGTPLDEALEAIRVLLGEGVRLFSLSFHSPSVAPGHTPYVRDAADLRAFYAWWDGVLALFAARGVASASPDQIVAAAYA